VTLKNTGKEAYMYIEKQLWNSLNVLIMVMDEFNEERYHYAISDIETDTDNDMMLCICKEIDNTYTHRIPLCKRSGVNTKAIGMLYDNSIVEEDGTVVFNLPYSVYGDMVEYENISREMKKGHGDMMKLLSCHTVITSHICNIEGVLYYMYKTISSECADNVHTTTRSIIVDKKFNNVMLYVDITKHTTDKNQFVSLHPIKSYAIKYPGDIDKLLNISSLKELTDFITSVIDNGRLYHCI